jgi:hypothetical protein
VVAVEQAGRSTISASRVRRVAPRERNDAWLTREGSPRRRAVTLVA